MAEVALYRKYRPADFGEVKGQEQVVSVLEGALAHGNVAHAYLFSGSRGTGKTSVARILAQKIGTSEKDLYEIDAASNRGIDNIRELREAVNTLPFASPYKVYIIDEVHMLTKEAFNALLKTLEEPPKHVIFVLATTEVEKLPETITSRCQTYTFKKPSRVILRDSITEVARKEGYTIAPAAADLIALLADGSFRDAHGVLQKIISAAQEKKIDLEHVERATGAPPKALVNDVIAALAQRDLQKGLAAVQRAVSQNLDMQLFVKLLLQKIRAVLLLRYAPTMEEQLNEQFGEDDVIFLNTVASDNAATIHSAVLRDLLETYEATARAAIPQLPLELALARLIGEARHNPAQS